MPLEENDQRSSPIKFKKAKHSDVRRFKKLLGARVLVGKFSMPVHYVTELVVDGESVMGAFCGYRRMIFVDIERGPLHEDVVATFLHELFHAEISESGLRQHPEWSHGIEEVVVDLLSRAIAFSFGVRRLGRYK